MKRHTMFVLCAWIMWELSQIQNPTRPELATRFYSIMGANSSEAGCRAMSKEMNATIDPKSTVLMFYCLPDTVDPRRVKP